jgi:hypothetical protein
LGAAFFTAFFAGFLAANFLAGAFFLVAIDNPPFQSAVAVDGNFINQHVDQGDQNAT